MIHLLPRCSLSPTFAHMADVQAFTILFVFCVLFWVSVNKCSCICFVWFSLEGYHKLQVSSDFDSKKCKVCIHVFGLRRIPFTGVLTTKGKVETWCEAGGFLSRRERKQIILANAPVPLPSALKYQPSQFVFQKYNVTILTGDRLRKKLLFFLFRRMRSCRYPKLKWETLTAICKHFKNSEEERNFLALLHVWFVCGGVGVCVCFGGKDCS